jgi:hypothetical protein
VYIRESFQFYDTVYNKFIKDTNKLANYLQHTGKELSKLVEDKIIPKYDDLCYYPG